ncbi:heterokaryon incompatibility protein-domain-containing protein [Apiosordaria backusii]|uniref:Heterokaryon incompatibility protein-domain-containing protein n=1 Tax=Apiosordaria backusii TaxID=314023 RepID=A0AA40K3Y9_9PEZI|nr:heterokaryon incompatibility protein-domain-containing protein [Apiosordaria backusii]
MPRRYGRARRPPPKHMGKIFLGGLPVLFLTYLLWKWLSIPPEEDIGITFLCVEGFVWMFLIAFDEPAIVIYFIPTFIGAIIFAAVSNQDLDTRALFILYISLAPAFILAFAFGAAIYGIMAYFILGVFWSFASHFLLRPIWNFPTIVYNLSAGAYVTRCPRFRNKDKFGEVKLCGRCKGVVGQSGLLSGSWVMFTRARERHLLCDRIEDMEDSGCSLCEALLSQRLADEEETGAATIVRGYGTMNTRDGERDLEAGGVQLKLEFVKSSLWSEADPNLAVFLEAGGTKKYLGLQVSEGLLTAEQKIPKFTGSDVTMKTISTWLKNCSDHKACRLPHDTPPFLPTRLIAVGTVGNPKLHLVNTKTDLNLLDHQNLVGKYIALSHCWGGNIPCKLTTSKYRAMWTSINETSLPANFRHAIAITRQLEIHYLWIDSLCILQDSPADWAAESPTMGQVFTHAHCVLAATASSDSTGGCFRHRSLSWVEQNIMTSTRKRCFVSNPPPLRALFYWRVEQSPLTNRAWAFQERLLARRVIHFCEDVVLFECNTLQASELHVNGVGYDSTPYMVRDGRLVNWIETIRSLTHNPGEGNPKERRAVRGIRGALDVLQRLGPVEKQRFGEKIEFWKRWYEIVSVYSKGQLTRQTDRLVALAGVAELVQQRAGLPYLAGLWDSDLLVLGLLWVVKGVEGRQELYCAPSWSWASVSGRIGFLPRGILDEISSKEKNAVFCTNVEKVEVWRNGKLVPEARSLVDNGTLTATGPIAKGKLVDQDCIHLTGANSKSGMLLRWLPDWKLEDVEKDGSQLFVLHLVKAYFGEQQIRSYGLVLRAKGAAEPGTFERIGVWSTQSDMSMENIVWEQQKIIVV